MTSNDRHASHDSSQRMSYHAGMNPPMGGVGRNPRLSTITTPPSGARPYSEDDPANRSTTALHGGYSPRPNGGAPSPNTPYSPGQRSSVVQNAAGDGIALQDFGLDGQPPSPPVAHSWQRIEVWAEENYPELFDQLCTPASMNDINELEYSLDCSLPLEVRESLAIHDGQERGGRPTGAIFSGMLLDCEEILDEWKNWRVVESEYMQTTGPSDSGEAGPSSASIGKSGLAAKQNCQPDDTVQKVYSHPGWIPMVRDWGGNYLAIDLAPGPRGTWGQVIIFGRDYDTKYVVSKSWAHFLAMYADDLQSSHWHVDEDSGDLKLRDPKAPRSEPSYFEILRVRNERKFGKRRMSRPPSQPGSRPGSSPGSPHLNPTTGERRGGLTRPPKTTNTMDGNHLMPPSKKSAAKQMRTVTEEPVKPQVPASVPVVAPTPVKAPEVEKSDLLDEPLEDKKPVAEEKREVAQEGAKALKRQSSDLMVATPAVEEKKEEMEKTIEV
ncbi:hypothetical protein FPQ18DRAFT_367475 [Pyronema domesticum]|nr:hypothetical protein FPQ18DRAFT_367475 [Pyronema domesticum]